MVQVACVKYNTVTDRDYSIESLINERITEIQTKDKGKIIDVKLTSTGDHVYMNIVALILYEVKENTK